MLLQNPTLPSICTFASTSTSTSTSTSSLSSHPLGSLLNPNPHSSSSFRYPFFFLHPSSHLRTSPWTFHGAASSFQLLRHSRSRPCVRAMALPQTLPSETNVLIFGSTGYIGRYVVKEMVNRGFNVIAVARERSGINGSSDRDQVSADLQGANVCFADVTDLASLNDAIAREKEKLNGPFHVVISCLASRSGGVKDSWKIDYEATMNSLQSGRSYGASHFVLLSAICVQKPLLEFQKAKLKFEAELQRLAMEESSDEKEGFSYSIVRPTAFFKSLGGQVETVKNGNPYIMFGDGSLCACKPISESDLASFIADCVTDEAKKNKILPIGGPGEALTPRQQGELLFRILGKEPRFLQVPIQIMDFAIGVLDLLVKLFPWLEDAAEFGKIGRYYAAESMLIYDPETGKYDADSTPSYGSDTLEEFFERVVREGMSGQELGDQAVFKGS